MTLTGEDLDLGKYFECGPPLADGLPKRMPSFFSRVEHVYEDGVKLLLTHASAKAPPGSTAFLLDLDVVQVGEVATAGTAMTAVDDLHAREGRAFEACITDATRKVFQ